MNRYGKLAVLLLAAIALMAQTPAQPAGGQTAEREPGLYMHLQTSMGEIVAMLFEKETPITVKNIVDLQLGRKAWLDQKTGQRVNKPLYTGVQFHRVIPQFMIQTGDPAGTGMGNVGFTIKDEIVPSLKFDKPGRLGMANIGQPNTGASQFFITTVPYPSLNGGYTLFGQVVQGQDVADKISMVQRNRDDKPLKPITIVKMTFERVGPAPANDVLKPRAAAAKPAAKKAAPAKK